MLGTVCERTHYPDCPFLLVFGEPVRAKPLARNLASVLDYPPTAKDDPTGIETLKQLIAPKKLPEFEREWRAWVFSL